MRIVIVGAGVAGCVMARRLALLDGVEVTCVERVSRSGSSPIVGESAMRPPGHRPVAAARPPHRTAGARRSRQVPLRDRQGGLVLAERDPVGAVARLNDHAHRVVRAKGWVVP